MDRRRLGGSDIEVSVVGLGCNNFGWLIDRAQSERVIHAALDAGVTYLDTADCYGSSEDIIGVTLGSRRKEVALATKFGTALDERRKGASSAYVVEALEASLRRLKTDFIDHYQLHRPDPETPIGETLTALDGLVRSGKVRCVGCSNLSPEQLEEAQETARELGLTAFVTTQDEYSILVQAKAEALQPIVERYGLSLIPYFPLANGLLTGKYRSAEDVAAAARLNLPSASFDPYRRPEMLQTAVRLQAFCAERGRDLVELAFSWLLSKSWVASVIAGATRPEQAVQNAGAGGWKLSPEELAQVDAIVANGLKASA